MFAIKHKKFIKKVKGLTVHQTFMKSSPILFKCQLSITSNIQKRKPGKEIIPVEKVTIRNDNKNVSKKVPTTKNKSLQKVDKNHTNGNHEKKNKQDG